VRPQEGSMTDTRFGCAGLKLRQTAQVTLNVTTMNWVGATYVYVRHFGVFNT
jgi:hypothetical protein